MEDNDIMNKTIFEALLLGGVGLQRTAAGGECMPQVSKSPVSTQNEGITKLASDGNNGAATDTVDGEGQLSNGGSKTTSNTARAQNVENNTEKNIKQNQTGGTSKLATALENASLNNLNEKQFARQT